MQVKVQPAALRSVEQAIHGRTMALESRHDGFRSLKGRHPRVESYALERVLGDTDAEKSRVVGDCEVAAPFSYATTLSSHKNLPQIAAAHRRTGVNFTPCECHNRPMTKLRQTFGAIGAAIAACIVGSGCVPVAVTAAGVGMGTGVSHALGGVVYKTFAAPQSKVQRATVAALRKMQIKVTETKREENKELITARATDRDIDIEIEALTPNATRITVVAKKDGGLIRDSATATEIILQTEKLVGTG